MYNMFADKLTSSFNYICIHTCVLKIFYPNLSLYPKHKFLYFYSNSFIEISSHFTQFSLTITHTVHIPPLSPALGSFFHLLLQLNIKCNPRGTTNTCGSLHREWSRAGE